MISINEKQILQALPMEECIDVMENLYKNEGGELASQPMRTLTRVDPESIVLTMPSYSKSLGRFAVKIVSEYKKNTKKFGLPIQGGVIVLIDAENSGVLATLDSPTITAVRTGAVSGLATRILSRKDSKKVAVIGSGQQARTLLEAVLKVRKIEEVKVYSRKFANALAFSKEMTDELRFKIEASEDRKSATRNADIMILATNSSIPVISWEEVSPGCHINSIGTLPDRREVDLETVCNSSLFVDIREGVLKEAGDVIDAIGSGKVTEKHIIADLAELVCKTKRGRQTEDEVTLFKSVGFALQDVYASSHVYDKVAAEKSGCQRPRSNLGSLH